MNDTSPPGARFTPALCDHLKDLGSKVVILISRNNNTNQNEILLLLEGIAPDSVQSFFDELVKKSMENP